MKSLFRKWSVMPSRAINDRELKERELRVLGALCIHTNAVGVCWPSMDTLCAVTGYKERITIHNAMKVLKRKRYVRQLQPKDYQETASGWKSNRYQVLWDGDEAMPSWEEIHAAKPLQLVADQDDAHANEIGGLGDLQQHSHTPDSPAAEAITHAYIKAVQQATGQVRLYDNEIAHARKLADAGHSAADVRAATLNVCDAALERRAGVPSLYDVAQVMS